MIALLIGVVSGDVPVKLAFSGFTSDVVVIIASALVVSTAIARSGAVELVLRPLLGTLKTARTQVPVLAGVTGLLSMATNILDGAHTREKFEAAAVVLLRYIEDDSDGFRILVRDSHPASGSGTFGSLMGTPIINQPQVAILAVGAIKKRPVVLETAEGDAIVIRHMMYLSLSYDHRVVDGSLGATFLSAVARELEQFQMDRQF